MIAINVIAVELKKQRQGAPGSGVEAEAGRCKIMLRTQGANPSLNSGTIGN